MRRFEALEILAEQVTDELVVTNLGRTADEWWRLRPFDGNLYTMGMGLVACVGLGMSVGQDVARVVALDGDGSLLFDLGALATIANSGADGYTLVVFDNASYASTGAHPTASAGATDLAAVAEGAGIADVWRADDTAAFRAAVEGSLGSAGTSVIVARVDGTSESGALKQMSGQENKYRFVRHMEERLGTELLHPLGGRDRSGGRQALPTAREEDADGLTAKERLTDEILHGLHASGTDFVTMVPASQLADAQHACADDPDLVTVRVANEGEGAAVCAGAWLVGRRPALMMESSGLLAAVYALVRCHQTFGIPTLLVMTHRGAVGERDWFAVATGGVLEPVIESLRIPRFLVDALADVAPTIAAAQTLMDASLTPTAILLSGKLTRP